MNEFSRRATRIIAALTLACGATAFSQEIGVATPPGENAGDQTAIEDEGPIRPKRGKGPTADRISGGTVETNPDGTMTRRTEVLGRVVEDGQGPASAAEATPAAEGNPLSELPQRATVSSTNNGPPVEERARATENAAADISPRRGYRLAAAAGVCIVVGLIVWRVMRQQRNVD